MTEALIAFAVMLVLTFLRLPIAYAMALIGVGGFAIVVGVDPALALLGQVSRDTVMTSDLSVVPLFILMGNFVSQARLSEGLYAASNAFLSHRRGGLAMATIVACGGFSSICGSSLATAATMSKVAMPSMRKYGYDPGFAAGSIAAGGTLGILIPPSVIFIFYGLMTGTSISKLFAAGILPGLLGIMLYIAAVQVAIRLRPELGPAAARTPWRERWRALSGVLGVLVLFVVVIGGIYLGVFTPTEAAGIGAFGGFLFALFTGHLTWRSLRDTLAETAITSSVLFAVLIGALLFANLVNTVGMPTALQEVVKASGLAPMGVIFLILLIYIILGCVLESMSMIILTIPVFVPLVDSLGFNLVWFGVVVVVVTEIALITPPVGMNVFVLRSMLPDVPTRRIFAGVAPFIAADVVRLAILVLIPWVSLFVPSLVRN
ncbi:MAG: TRAP transporter large permease [Rhodospirillaceae bacterium]|nr:TRAP transporter large permease [Rhodospirillaceae bacterium]